MTDRTVLSDRHIEMMEKTIGVRESVLDKYFKTKVENETSVSEDSVYAIVALANSIDGGIDKLSKLKMAEKKLGIEASNAINLDKLAQDIHAARVSAFKNRPSDDEIIEATEFKELDINILEGELIQGQDAITYEDFLNKQNDD